MNKKKAATAPKKKTAPTAAVVIHQEQPEQNNQVQQYTPDAMLFIAVKEGRSLEEISRLMDLHDRWVASRAKAEYMKAKSKFIALVPRIEKKTNVNYDTKTGPKVNYNYAELGEIGESVKAPCSQCGLSFDWDIDDKTEAPKVRVTCILSHIDGHEKTTSLSADLDTSGGKTGIHAKSSTISYLKRITLEAVLGLTTASADDDGRAGRENPFEQVVDNAGKMTPTVPEYGNIMKSVMAGTTTVDQVKEHFNLTEEQIKALKIAEDARNNRKDTTNN